MSLTMTLIQIKSATEFRGRTMSLAMTFGLMPLSAVPFGSLAERIGTANAYISVIIYSYTIIFCYKQKNKKYN